MHIVYAPRNSRRHTYPEAARVLRVNETWLRRHIRKLPHTKLGRTVYFTDPDIERIDSLFHHEPTAGPRPLKPVSTAGFRPYSTSGLVPLASRRSARGSL